MALASINFKPVKANSKVHNERLDPDSLKHYLRTDLSEDNKQWKGDEISSRLESITHLAKEKTGRSMQAKATPIREACVNIEQHHTIEDLKRVSSALKEKYGIDCFQIFIHRDEGRWLEAEEKKPENERDTSKWKPNYHAHMVFDWQDKNTGKSFKLHKLEMSQIQTLVSNVLGMERGELKTNSNRERLEPIEYKRQQEELRHQMLQEQNEILEQKKNEVRARIERLASERETTSGETNSESHRGRKEAFRELILVSEDDWTEKGANVSQFDESDLIEAISILEREIERIENGFKDAR